MVVYPLLAILGAGFVPPTTLHRSSHPPTSAITVHRPLQSAAVARTKGAYAVFFQRDLTFDRLDDEELAMAHIYRLAEAVCSYTKEDWDMWNAALPPPLLLDKKASKKIGGVVIHYLGWGGQGREGSLEIECVDQLGPQAQLEPLLSWDRKRPRNKRIVFTTVGSRRKIVEEMLFKLVLEEIRRGGLRGKASLSIPQIYPRSTDEALFALRVENRRLRKQLQEFDEALSRVDDAEPAWSGEGEVRPTMASAGAMTRDPSHGTN
jgi:hypothetical protein